MAEDNSISLNKYISDSGYCSRREADKLIENAKVKLNGKIAQKGNRVYPGDQVILDGKKIKPKSSKVYLALNKPRGVECTTNRKVKDNIIDFINYPTRVFPVGRLDKDSEGLILLTNDGDILNKILRSKNENQKEYLVTVDRDITDNFMHHMHIGVPILGRITKKADVQKVDNKTFKIILTEGLNRQIRRMCEALDYKVTKLQRIRVLNIELGQMPKGSYRELNPSELQELKKALKSSQNN